MKFTHQICGGIIRLASWMCSRQICPNYVMQSLRTEISEQYFQHPFELRNEELRLKATQNYQSVPNKVTSECVRECFIIHRGRKNVKVWQCQSIQHEQNIRLSSVLYRCVDLLQEIDQKHPLTYLMCS